MQNTPEPLPGSNKVKRLLDASQKEAASRYAIAFSQNWFKLAGEGKLMNLSDLMGVSEQIIEDQHKSD